jgi:tetratricopeptide (TPR) repeat protein
MPVSTPCPTPHQLEDFARGRLSAPESESFARHLKACPACSTLFDTLQGTDGRAAAGHDGKADAAAELSAAPTVVSLFPRSVASVDAVPATLQHAGRPLTQTGTGAATPGDGAAAGAPLPAVPGYELRAVLGKGGMGVVYRAEQVALKRTVALKMVLAGGHADAEALARFRGEAEAVARLRHPNIVQIYEIGEHNGLPFFSLEYVSGGSLHQYLDGTPLPARAAAALIETAARAIHHAHERDIVHRDLKPANILLDRPPGAGRADLGTPKIADFGLAKRLDDANLRTASGAVLGTPSYMAPEQAAGRTAATGPLSDVYALGAILYELLTGRPPFKGAMPTDTLLQVVSQEPVPPRRLNAQVPRDLETICLKALEKQPGRRYASAQELADDLGRFARGEPIRARPVGGFEQGWRWCRRNPAVALLSAAALLLLVGGLAGMTGLYLNAEEQRAQAERERRRAEDERRRADDERETAKRAALEADRQKKSAEDSQKAAREQADRSQQVTESLKGMFEVSDPMGLNGFFYGASDKLAGTRLTALDLLRYSKERTRKNTRASPRVKADILDTIGNVYRSLAQYEEAEKLLKEAHALRVQAKAPKAEIAASLHSLGWLNHELGNYPQALGLYRAALELRLKEPEPDPVAIANSRFNLAWALAEVEGHAEAEALFKQCVEARRQHFGPDSRETALAKVGLAAVYLDRGRYAPAIPLVEEAIATFRKVSEDKILPDALALFEKGVIRSMALQDHLGGEKMLRASLELARKRLGEKHLFVTMPLVQLAIILEAQGRHRDAEAQALYEETVEIVRDRLGRLAHPKLLIAVRRLAGVQRRRGQAAKADALFKEVLEHHEERFGREDPFVANVLVEYAEFLDGIAYPARRAELLEKAARIYREAKGPPRLRFAPCLNALGVLRYRERNYPESERRFREALGVARKQDAAPKALFIEFLCNTAQALLAQNKLAEAEAPLAEAETLLAAVPARDQGHPRHGVVLARCRALRLRSADHAAVAKRLGEYRKRMLPHGWRAEDMAYEFAQCLPLVERDPKLGAEEKGRLRAEYGDEAVALLRQALARGVLNPGRWENEPLLMPLREREDFQRLLAGLRKK